MPIGVNKQSKQLQSQFAMSMSDRERERLGPVRKSQLDGAKGRLWMVERVNSVQAELAIATLAYGIGC
jgi:hypothetical protein